MVNTDTSHSGENQWRFVPRQVETPFAGTSMPRMEADPQGTQRAADYATSFPPELYQKLRVFVQTKGWNTLLDGVTIRRGEQIVDLGFGDGGNTQQLATDLRVAALDCLVFGVEKDPKMFHSAQESYPRSANPNLILLHGSAENAGTVLRNHMVEEDAELSSAPITRVVSNYTLHWVRDPADPTQFLHAQMFRYLNPLQPIGGEQRHFCAHQDAFKELFDAGYDIIREDAKWQNYFQVQDGDYVENNEWRHPPLVTKEGIEEALRSAGYAGEATLHVDAREFPNVALLKAWVKTMIRPFMNLIPEDNQDPFVEAWIDRYLKNTGQSRNGPVKLWDRNLLVVAEKVHEVS